MKRDVSQSNHNQIPRKENEMSEGKQRHGCLTAWLVLMIFANSATALLYLLGSAAMRQNFPSAPGWAFPMLGVMGIANVVCAVALFQWKKMGILRLPRDIDHHIRH